MNTAENVLQPFFDLNSIRPGTGDEYNDEARESDDGNADNGGFIHATDIEETPKNAGEAMRRINRDTGDQTWRDMYR